MTLPEPFYDDGQCVIYHGDCRELLPLIEADVMVTDPPYAISHASGRCGKWRNHSIAGDDSTASRDDAITQWGGRPAIVFGTWKIPPPTGTLTALVWDKGPSAGMGDLSLPWKPNWELVYILGHGFMGRRTSGVLSGYRIVTWSSKSYGRIHPNEKPVGLMRDLIGKCPPGVIVDPFMGSGTTLRAAKDLGRRAIGIEIEREWCELAVQRLRQEVLPLGDIG